MSKTTHYELNTPIGSEVLSVMTGLNPNFTKIDNTMYDNETRSTQALNKANVNEQNIATALGRITTAEGDIDTLESGLQTANTNISGLTSRMNTAEGNIVTANNRIQENTGDIVEINTKLNESLFSKLGYKLLEFESANTTFSGTEQNLTISNLPDNVTDVYIISAHLGGYVLPFVGFQNSFLAIDNFNLSTKTLKVNHSNDWGGYTGKIKLILAYK